VTDPDLAPLRLTPRTQLALEPTPAQTPGSFPRAATPMPTIPWMPSPTPVPKTPTSIDQGIGQVAPAAPRSRRGVAIGVGAVVLIALGSAGGYVYTQRGGEPDRAPVSPPAPVAAPAPAPEPPKPVVPEPAVAKPAPVQAEEPKLEEPKADAKAKIAVKPKPRPIPIVHAKPKKADAKSDSGPGSDDMYTKRQ
jgi:hypothetical protein